MPSSFLCQFCLLVFPTGGAMRQHQSKTEYCRNHRNEALAALTRQASHPRPQELVAEMMETEQNINAMDVDTTIDLDIPQTEGSSNEDFHDPDPVTPSPRGSVTIEEVEDEDAHPMYRSRKPFPREKVAGATFGEARTGFHDIRDDQILKDGEVLGPFASEAEWELAKWLMKNVGHNQVEEFLKLPIVSLYPFDVAREYSQRHFDFADSRTR